MTFLGNQDSHRKIFKSIMILCAASLLVSGCSSMPNWANPVEWYKGTKDWVVGGSNGKEINRRLEKRIIDKDFPKLSSVPQRPTKPNIADIRKLEQSLRSDRASARYSDQKINRQRTAAVPMPITVKSLPAAPVVRKKTVKRVKPNKPKILSNPTSSDTIKNVQTIRLDIPKKIVNSSGISPERKFVRANPFAIRFPSGTANRFSLAGSNPTKSSISGDTNRVAIVLFKTGSSSVTVKGQNTIRKIAKLFKKQGGYIHVIGHASSRTRDMSWKRHHFVNFKISFDRAHAVGRQFRLLGVPPTAIRISAVTDSKPQFSEVMPAEEAGNRRVEIFLGN